MARGAKTSPAAERRRAKRAAKRIEDNSSERSSLMHMQGGAISEKPMRARRKQENARVPARVRVAQLTAELDQDFSDLRVDQVGRMEPGSPKTSGAFRR